ncbi:MAG: hypothetical protein NTX03_10735 [Bacteroidetes bacterium]|nr:hypothetical protein [Bacteroidota bacterium]
MHRFDIDKLIRSVFRQNKPTVSAAEKDDIWENIEHFLDAEPRMQRRKMGAVWMALVILMTSVGGYWGSNRVDRMSSVNELEKRVASTNHKKDFVRNEKPLGVVRSEVNNHEPFGKLRVTAFAIDMVKSAQTSLLTNRIKASEKTVLVRESLKENTLEKMSFATIGFKEAYSFIN